MMNTVGQRARGVKGVQEGDTVAMYRECTRFRHCIICLKVDNCTHTKKVGKNDTSKLAEKLVSVFSIGPW